MNTIILQLEDFIKTCYDGCTICITIRNSSDAIIEREIPYTDIISIDYTKSSCNMNNSEMYMMCMHLKNNDSFLIDLGTPDTCDVTEDLFVYTNRRLHKISFQIKFSIRENDRNENDPLLARLSALEQTVSCLLRKVNNIELNMNNRSNTNNNQYPWSSKKPEPWWDHLTYCSTERL